MPLSTLNTLSLKKINQLNDEAPARIALCNRAGGKPIEWTQKYRRNDGTVYDIKRVTCTNGTCECGCGKFGHILEPHEVPRRSQGGKVSLHDSIMVRHDCHVKLDERKVKLQWL